MHIAVPPLSYSIWGPFGIIGGFSPTPRRTLQQFEMDDDLGDSDPKSLGYGGKAVPGVFRTAGAIWPTALSQVNLFVYSDTSQELDLQVLRPGTPAILNRAGQSSSNVPLIAGFTVSHEGLHLLQAKLSRAGAAPARIYVKVDYLGPASLNVP